MYGSSKNVTIGRIGAIAVDSSGRVFIANNQQSTIDVFTPDGRYLTHLGGKGPGEFLSIFKLQIMRDQLYVYDENQLKECVFTLHPLALKNTITLAGNRDKYPALKKAFPYIEKLYVRNNNTYLAEFLSSVVSRNMHNPQKLPKKWQNYDTKGMFYLLNKDGDISSKKLFDFKNDTRIRLSNRFAGGLPLYYFFRSFMDRPVK